MIPQRNGLSWKAIVSVRWGRYLKDNTYIYLSSICNVSHCADQDSGVFPDDLKKHPIRVEIPINRMTSLPALSTISSHLSHPESPLARALSVLFEPSPILISTLEPQLALALNDRHLTSYVQLVDVALDTIASWDSSSQAEFIAGHPRIGESKGLSSLSAKEQGATALNIVPTPPEVLERLSHLNACYETKYAGLRYITFVNGRTRRTIAEEMEDLLGLEHSLSSDKPPVADLSPVEVDGPEWQAELRRAVQDVGNIAKSRLGMLGVEGALQSNNWDSIT
jgi:2-oxo-4-hydroxy-4-carboxy--5-ureidoimidazoline (OHCU) decarboxylase